MMLTSNATQSRGCCDGTAKAGTKACKSAGTAAGTAVSHQTCNLLYNLASSLIATMAVLIKGSQIGLIVLVSCSWLAAPVNAEETQLFDQFSLSAQARGDVQNELLLVTLQAQDQHAEPATLANSINAKMQWALSIVKRYGSLEVKTLNYNTWPRYSKGTSKIVGWYANQQLQIESEDVDTAQKVIQLLQEKLTISGMQMTATNEAREALEDTLISEALERFKDRAAIVQRNMGALSYRIVSVDIHADNNVNTAYRQRSMEMAMDARVSEAPAIEAGTSEIVVRVHGNIALQ